MRDFFQNKPIIVAAVIVTITSIFFPLSFAENHEKEDPIADFFEKYGVLVSTIVFSIGICVAIWGNGRQFKQGIQSMQLQSYQKLRTDHMELGRRMHEDQTIQKILKLEGDEEIDFDNLTQLEKKKIILFYLAELDLYERLQYEYSEGKINELEWIQWHMWLEKIKTPLLEKTFRTFEHIFDMREIQFLEETLFKNNIFCKKCNKREESFEEIVKHHKKNHLKS